MNQLIKRLLAIVLIAMHLSAMFAGCGKPAAGTEPPTQEEITEPAEVIRQSRTGIQTVLVSCLDNYNVEELSGYRNANRADFLLLLVIDEQNQKITSVQINPDTVVSFEIPGKHENVEVPVGHIHTYGSGGSDSCLNVSGAISAFLGGIKVNHYLAFSRDALQLVNDAIGGVTVPIAASTDEVEPETVTLSGEAAAEFFSLRNQEDVTNEIHMEKQRRYMKGLYPPFMAATQDDNFLSKLSLQLGENMTTDLTLSQLILMFETLAAYEMEEKIVTFTGESQITDGAFCFYPDQESVRSQMEKLIY